jgi:DHA1 family tetracycline resistance protein-like MFS transporter
MGSTADAIDGDPPHAADPDRPVRLTRLRLMFVLAVVLLNTTSLGIVSPVLPILVKRLAHGDAVAAAAAIGLFTAAWAAMQLIFAPVLGVLSDRFGRRPIALLSMVELSVDYVVMALAPALSWLFIGRVFSGMAAAGRAAIFAYVADVAAPDERSRYFGLLAAAGGIGTVLGPGLGGFLGEISPRAPFWSAAAIGLVNAAYGFIVLKESLPRSRRTPFTWLRANPFGALWILFEAKGLLSLAVIMVLANIGMSGFFSVYVLYLNAIYHWTAGQAGLALMAYAAATIVAQGVLAGPVARRLGEKGAIVVSFLSGAAGLALIGLAPWPPMLWIGVVAIAPVNVGIAAIQSMRSKLVEPGEQGRLQGAMISLAGLSGIVGPVIFAGALAWSLGAGRGAVLPGVCMLAGAAVFLAAIAITAVTVSTRPPEVASD